MTQEQELQEVLKKNLPQHVGDVLKTRLEQADKDAKRVVNLEKEVQLLEEQEKVFKDTIKEYQKFDERNASLDSREKELETERNSLELEKLKYQLQSEKDKTTFSQNVALGLVRNIEYRKNIFDSETSGQPVTDHNGYIHYPMPTSKQHKSTDTAE